MTLTTGAVYTGTVKNITNFGAFVEIINPENSHDKATGMVHISEIADSYIKDIHDFLKEGQEVKVVVTSVNENGKYSFSIKKVPDDQKLPFNQTNQDKPKPSYKKDSYNQKDENKNEGDNSFEAMMSRFKRISEDKTRDLKKSTERRNKSRRK